MLRTVLILLTPLLVALLPPPQQPGHPVAQPRYDSTRVNLRNSPGISHKTVMQAARTFSRIGGHQPLDRADSAFLRIWSPAIIGAPDNPHPPQLPPQPSRVVTP